MPCWTIPNRSHALQIRFMGIRFVDDVFDSRVLMCHEIA